MFYRVSSSFSTFIACALLLAVPGSFPVAQERSTCFGSTADGSLENGWKLPSSGPNFEAYSSLGSLLGRTYVHSDVHDVVLTAYTALEEAAPDKVFVYGETGKKSGGEFDPHKTHRNGLSVDFMVPVIRPVRRIRATTHQRVQQVGL